MNITHGFQVLHRRKFREKDTMKTENTDHMIDYLEIKIQKMQKTAEGLQKRIKKESKALTNDQVKGLQALEKSTVNAIKQDKKYLHHLKTKENEDT